MYHCIRSLQYPVVQFYKGINGLLGRSRLHNYADFGFILLLFLSYIQTAVLQSCVELIMPGNHISAHNILCCTINYADLRQKKKEKSKLPRLLYSSAHAFHLNEHKLIAILFQNSCLPNTKTGLYSIGP